MTVAPRPIVQAIWNRALDTVFPRRCVACRDYGAFLCDDCVDQAIRATHSRCSICWTPTLRDSLCSDCVHIRPAYFAARSVFAYDTAPRDAVHTLKYRGISGLAPVMSSAMAQLLTEWAPAVDCVVPVPLTGHRRRLRGYNQSELLARELSRLSQLPLETKALKRRQARTPQVHQPDRQSRLQNVAGAFALGSKPARGSVLLIDDVMTTGATLDACARVLLDGGATAVYALTFARGSGNSAQNGVG